MDKSALIIQQWWKDYKAIKNAKLLLNHKKTVVNRWIKRYRNQDDLVDLCLELEDKLYKLQNDMFSLRTRQIENIHLEKIVSRLIGFGLYNITITNKNTVSINDQFIIKHINQNFIIYKIIKKNTPAYTKVTNCLLFSSKSIDQTFERILSLLSC